MSKGKVYDFTDQVRRAWEHFDALLDVKIQHIHELTGVEKERLIKINPLEFITSDFIDKLPDSFKRNYQHKDLGEDTSSLIIRYPAI